MSNTTKNLLAIGLIAWLLWPKKGKANTTSSDDSGSLDEMKLAFQPFGDTMYIHVFNMDQTVHETLVIPPYYDSTETVYAFGKEFTASWDHQLNVVQLTIEDGNDANNVVFYIASDGTILDVIK